MTDRDDLDQLLNNLIGIAQDQLTKRDGFLPYFGTLAIEGVGDGQVQLGMAQLEEDKPSPLAVRSMSLEGLKVKAREKSIRACALITDVSLKDDAVSYDDAIHVLLEHSSGRVVNFQLPYRKNEHEYAYGEAIFSAGDPEIFVD